MDNVKIEDGQECQWCENVGRCARLQDGQGRWRWACLRYCFKVLKDLPASRR